MEWPARSPDITPPDFFLWGYLKDKVYSEKIRDIEHLKGVIVRRLQEIKNDPELVRRVTCSVSAMIQLCMDAGGGMFEQNK